MGKEAFVALSLDSLSRSLKGRCSLFVVRCSLFVVRCSSFVVSCSLDVVRGTSFVVLFSSFEERNEQWNKLEYA